MLGWFSAATAWVSCSKRRSRSLSLAKDSGRIFKATSRPKRVSRARYTSPMPPAPTSDWISYGPILVPWARGMSARSIAQRSAKSIATSRFTDEPAYLDQPTVGHRRHRHTDAHALAFVYGGLTSMLIIADRLPAQKGGSSESPARLDQILRSRCRRSG